MVFYSSSIDSGQPVGIHMEPITKMGYIREKEEKTPLASSEVIFN